MDQDLNIELIDDMSTLKDYVLDMEQPESTFQCGGGRVNDAPLVDPEGYLVPLKRTARRRGAKSINKRGGSRKRSVGKKTLRGSVGGGRRRRRGRKGGRKTARKTRGRGRKK